MVVKVESLSEKIDICFNPEKYGYKDCEACDGFGDKSKNHDLNLYEKCDVCGGDGVVPMEEKI